MREELKRLAAMWPTVLAEALSMAKYPVLATNREGKTHEQLALELKDYGRPVWTPSWGECRDKWLTLGLGINDEWPFDVMPETLKVLRGMKGVKVAALSLFRPGVLLLEHNHPTLAGCETFHLGLAVPNNCYLNTNGTFVQEMDGHGFTFPGALPHFAFNASERDRLVFYAELAGV